MTSRYARVTAHWESVIPVPAETAWRLLTDWRAVERWWGNRVSGDAMQIESVRLEGTPTELPRTRVIVRSNAAGAGLPAENREKLFHEDELTRRIYYTADNDVVAGVRNYIATTCIDSVTEKSCRMIFSSTFDVGAEHDASKVRAIIESVYDGICEGFRRYFAHN